jgi:hypothetical protein
VHCAGGVMQICCAVHGDGVGWTLGAEMARPFGIHTSCGQIQSIHLATGC